MKAIRYVDELNKHYGSMGFPPYQWTINDAAPLARLWSGFMGRIYNRTKLIEESAPAFIEKLREDAVDILVAAPD